MLYELEIKTKCKKIDVPVCHPRPKGKKNGMSGKG
jgi:hypothetical protein